MFKKKATGLQGQIINTFFSRCLHNKHSTWLQFKITVNKILSKFLKLVFLLFSWRKQVSIICQKNCHIWRILWDMAERMFLGNLFQRTKSVTIGKASSRVLLFATGFCPGSCTAWQKGISSTFWRMREPKPKKSQLSFLFPSLICSLFLLLFSK